MPSALVFLAEGAEEMETVICVDILRRGGVDVTLAGVAGKGVVKCSRNINIVPDVALEEVLNNQYDVLVLPGGLGGAKILAESAALAGGMYCTKGSPTAAVGTALQEQEKRGALVAAVCAAPTALMAHGIGKKKKVTSHPSVGDKMKAGGYSYSEDRVVQDGKLITSRGPGTCFQFALKIVENLVSKEKADSLIGPMLVKM